MANIAEMVRELQQERDRLNKAIVVVITGASSGLGESTARHLAKLGATVVLGSLPMSERCQSLP